MFAYSKFLDYCELIELRAKLVSVFPFALGLIYAKSHFGQLHVLNSCILFVLLLFIHMAVDMINNYMDYYGIAVSPSYKKQTNVIGRSDMDTQAVLRGSIAFFTAATLLGIYLSIQIGWSLFFFGVFSFAIGVLYSAGPLPLSYLPLGEILAGGLMGVGIPVVTVWVNYPFPLEAQEISSLTLFSLPFGLVVAGLMLTNNLCDIEEDRYSGRLTLACMIGRRKSLRLLGFLYLLAIGFVGLDIYLGILPVIHLLSVLVIFPIYLLYRQITVNPTKQQAFPIAIRITAWFFCVQTLALMVGLYLE